MKITSVIKSDSPLVSVVIEDGFTEVAKTVTFWEYQNVCVSLARDVKVQRVGQLPAGFVDGGVCENTYEAIIKVPGGRRPLNYFGKEYLITFPDVVFYLASQGGNALTTKVWFAGESGALYHYPFGNVHSDARICWGGNVLPKVMCMKDMEKLVSLFFSAQTNDDLYKMVETKIDGKDVSLSQREFIEYVSKMDTFPMGVLRPFGLTINQI